MFIKLTLGDGNPVYINPDSVERFFQYKQEKFTRVYFGIAGDHTDMITVKESPERIIALVRKDG